jgi:hypothetical protein
MFWNLFLLLLEYKLEYKRKHQLSLIKILKKSWTQTNTNLETKWSLGSINHCDNKIT